MSCNRRHACCGRSIGPVACDIDGCIDFAVHHVEGHPDCIDLCSKHFRDHERYEEVVW